MSRSRGTRRTTPSRLGRAFPGRPVRSALAATALSAVLVTAAPGAAAGQAISGGGWDADERVLITDFQRVTSLARSSDRLFAATDGGLVVMSDAFGRWELPITREDGWPQSQVLAIAFDRRDGTLWLATRDGRLLQLDVFGRRWLDDVSVPGVVSRIVAPADEPSRLYLRRGDRWLAFDPFTRQTAPVDGAEVRRAIERDFDLRARSELLGEARWETARPFLGRRGSDRYEVTDVMPSAAGAGQFWVATYGGFLERFDSFSGDSRPLDYGVVGLGAAAVAVSEDAVWIAPAHASDRYGVATADAELEEWRTWGGGSFGYGDREAPDAPIRAWLRVGDDTWAGGDRGLYRFDGESWRRVSLGERTDVAPITALADGPEGPLGGVWVGTGRGLLRIRSATLGPDALLLGARRVEALAAHAGDLWIGTDLGLVRLARTAATDSTLPLPEAGAWPSGRVGALATDGDRLYAGVERDLWVLDRGGEWTRPAPLGVLPARVTALAARDGVVWVGSDEGLVAWETGNDRVTSFTFAAGDLPTGPRGERGVASLALEAGDVVWAATPAGAVRLDADW